MQNYLWWFGVPLVVGILAWGPYAALNIVNDVSWPFWRVRFVPIAIFDSGAYFEMIGAAISGLAYGDHIRTFDGIIRILGRIVPVSWSVAEVWLLTLWASVVAGIWMMARAMGVWSGSPQWRSRLLSVIAWCSLILPFMPRPGIFTWYVAFYAFGLIGVWQVQKLLPKASYGRCLAWTASALAAAWVYPFFFVHLFIWLVVLWSVHAYEKFRRAAIICSAIGVICVILAVVFLYPWLLKPEFQLAFEVQRRLGLSFTRLPVVSNSLLLVVAWTGLVVFMMYIFRKRPEARGRFYALFVGWVTLLCAWLSNVFTDVYIHNDHFRAPAVLLSWLSLSVVWSVVIAARKAEAGEDALWQRWPRSVFRISFVFFIGFVAILAVYIVGKTYVFHGDYLNVVHVSHWITIVAAFVILWSGINLKHQGSLTALAWTLMFMAALLGVSARGYIFFTEASLFSYYRSYVPVTDWIRKHLPSEDGICADPQHGEALGSFSGRFVYPTYLIEFLPKPDEEIINDIQIEMGHYDVQSAIARDVYIQIFDSMDTTCSQFSVWSRLFVLFGWSRDEFDEISGCPRAEMSALQERLGKYASAHLPNDARFRELCPAVVIASDQVDFWSLPEDYRETVIDEAFSVWRTSNDE